jgi:hemolysin III
MASKTLDFAWCHDTAFCPQNHDPIQDFLEACSKERRLEMICRKFTSKLHGLSHHRLNGYAPGAAILAFLGLVGLLILGHNNLVKVIALLIYGISLVAMFSSSATYHLVDARPRIMLFLRKLDHASIYVLIAGTYTPICLHFFSGFWAWGTLTIIWSLALIGVLVKLFIIKLQVVWLLFIFRMGWLSLLAATEDLSRHALGLFGCSWVGYFYPGAVIYVSKKPDFFPGVFGFHEVWHIFVILGYHLSCHFILMAAYVLHAHRAWV